MRRFIRLMALAIPVLAFPLPAFAADCFDVFGCSDKNIFKLADLLDGPNCDFLYMMRNDIFASHGYCFKTAKAIQSFGNDNCRTSNFDELGLNRVEKANVETIVLAEQNKGCGG